jgi:hypothetical protein
VAEALYKARTRGNIWLMQANTGSGVQTHYSGADFNIPQTVLYPLFCAPYGSILVLITLWEYGFCAVTAKFVKPGAGLASRELYSGVKHWACTSQRLRKSSQVSAHQVLQPVLFKDSELRATLLFL